MVRIIICEDNEAYIEILKNKIESCMRDTIKEECEIISFSDIVSFRKYYRSNDADIIFMDIIINSENMMDRYIEHPDKKNTPVIFITSFPEAAYNISESNCCYFLIKSKIKDENMEKAIRRAMYINSHRDEAPVTIRTGNSSQLVNYRDIVYIESFSNNLSVHLFNSEPIKIYSSLKKVEKGLPEYFCRCHKSFIINMKHITGYKPYCFITDTHEEIPVPLKKYRESINTYEEFLENK